MKWLARLLVLYLVVLASVVVIAVAVPGSPRPASGGSFSHQQLEADRVMTQQMAVDISPGMTTVMGSYEMLQRSSDPAYVAALEQHIAQFDRSIGASPPGP